MTQAVPLLPTGPRLPTRAWLSPPEAFYSRTVLRRLRIRVSKPSTARRRCCASDRYRLPSSGSRFRILWPARSGLRFRRPGHRDEAAIGRDAGRLRCFAGRFAQAADPAGSRLFEYGYDPFVQLPWSRSVSSNWTAAGMFSVYFPTQIGGRNVTGESTFPDGPAVDETVGRVRRIRGRLPGARRAPAPDRCRHGFRFPRPISSWICTRGSACRGRRCIILSGLGIHFDLR